LYSSDVNVTRARVMMACFWSMPYMHESQYAEPRDRISIDAWCVLVHSQFVTWQSVPHAA